jgi:hypothetical protein
LSVTLLIDAPHSAYQDHRDMNRRLTRLTGVAFVVTILVSEVLGGDSPSPTGPVSGSVALAVRPGLTPPWYRWGSLATAALFLVGGAAAALARNGFFAPDGGYGFILFWLPPIWVAVTAFVATPRRVTPSPANATG